MNGRSIRHPRENQKPGAKLERAADAAEPRTVRWAGLADIAVEKSRAELT
jgi:hypothetical protein